MKAFIPIFFVFFCIEENSSYRILPIRFEHNSSEISATELTNLKSAAETLNVISEKRNGKKFTLWIEGHANSTESDPKQLAKSRSKAVSDNLVKLKLPRLKIIVQDFGSEKPMVDPNSENKDKNQRVEFKMN